MKQRVRQYATVVAAVVMGVTLVFSPQLARAAEPYIKSYEVETDIGGWATDEPIDNIPMDTDGDGQRDLVRVFKGANGKAMTDVLLSDGSGFYRPDNPVVLDVGGWSEHGEKVRNLAMDINGDGKEDLMRLWRTHDGHAKTDTLFSWGKSFYRTENPVSQDMGDWSVGPYPVKRFPMYVNNDKKADLVAVFTIGDNKARVDVLFSHGDGSFYRPGPANPQIVGDWDQNGQNVIDVPMDANGDRMEDLVRITRSPAGKAMTEILFSDNWGFYPGQDSIVLDVGDWHAYGEDVLNLGMDADADGKADLVRQFRSGDNRRGLDMLYSHGRSFYRSGALAPGYLGAADNNLVFIHASKPLAKKAAFFQLRNVNGKAHAKVVHVDRYGYWGSHQFTPGSGLGLGRYLRSANGKYRLLLQEDGNLVLSNLDDSQTIWASNTAGQGGTYFTLQHDGNAVLYRPDGSVVWATNTFTWPASSLEVRDDGNLVMNRANGQSIWETKLLPNPNAPLATSVLTYNLGENTTIETLDRLNAIATTIREGNADVVLLNEIYQNVTNTYFQFDPVRYIAEQAGYPYWEQHYSATLLRFGTGTGHKALAILSRHPISNKQYHSVEVEGCTILTFCPTFGMLQATVHIRGVPHQVFSTRLSPMHRLGDGGKNPQYHWSEWASNRNGHQLAQQLISAVPPGQPIIFGGDLNNEWRWTWDGPEDLRTPWAIAFRDNSGLRDSVVEFERQDPNLTNWNGRVDYIYFRGPYVLRRTDHRCGYPYQTSPPCDHAQNSDHEYVYAEFGYSQAGAEAAANSGGSSMNY